MEQALALLETAAEQIKRQLKLKEEFIRGITAECTRLRRRLELYEQELNHIDAQEMRW